jgi:hypothetical protein
MIYIGEICWHVLSHILRDKNIELSLEDYNRYWALTNEECKKLTYGKVGTQVGYETEGQISESLDKFKVTANINLTNGQGTLPVDYWHKSRMEVTSSGVEIKFCTAKEALKKRNSSITNPSLSYPIYELMNGYFQVYPITVVQVTFVYLQDGDVPKVVLKIQNGVEIYDTANSVEPKWGMGKLMDLIRIFLGFLNLQIPPEQLLAYTEQKLAKDNAAA